MIWLYCKGGTVLGTHEPHLNYSPDIYGEGVTIVPYRGSLHDLPKIGPDWHEGAGVDPRPYSAPSLHTKEELSDYAMVIKQLAVHNARSRADLDKAYKTLEAALEAIKSGKITSQAQVDSAK